MGQRTVKRRNGTWQPVWLQGTDGWLLLAVILLLLWGLLMVYSTSPTFQWFFGRRQPNGGVDVMRLVRRQTMFVFLGLGLMAFLAAVDYRRWQRLAPLVLFGVWGALMVALALKHIGGGTGRFLSGGSVQPSELAKVATVFYLAVWLSRREGRLSSREYGLYPLGFLLGVTGGLVLLEPDLSAAITIVAIGMLMFFLAGGGWRQLALVGGAALLGGALVLLVYPRGMHRLQEYLAGLQDPTHAADQIRLAISAAARGGWFGVGPGQSQVKVSGLPLPHSDSVFAVVAEEYGVVGSALMVLLFAVIVWRGMRIALEAPDAYGRLLASGLSLWLGLEAFSNMSMMLNVLPLAGNALPFISYGGSNLVSALLAVGLILSVGRASAREHLKARSDTGAVVDLRRGHGRRRVSRAVGASGTGR